MGEAANCLTPPPKPSRPLPPRTPMASRLQSPPAFPLGSNDDQLERAKARAARAASIRRKSIAPAAAAQEDPSPSSDLLHRDQIMDLFHNCIKLASENKINQKNTWELGLIDHLSEIVRARPEDDDETNFQKASCTLEAGVKIYSMRVDSVHSEAYKVLGGINRAGREEGKETSGECNDVDTVQGEGMSKKDLERKMSPVSTLESSFEVLNVKKFDAAFTVDPLYHQTSAQFDEGGAKGLLLNNLGVYGGCRVLFDSLEAPDKSILTEARHGKTELIDLSFVKEHIESMMIHMPVICDISPTLKDILDHFDEENRRPSDTVFSGQMPVMEDNMLDDNQAGLDANTSPDCGPWNFDNDDHESVVDDMPSVIDPYPTSYQEASGDYMFEDPGVVDEKIEKIADFLSLGLGFSSKTNAWAGPDHWKYRKVKGLEPTPVSSGETETAAKKPKNRKGVPDIDFTKSLDNEMSDIFAPPKNPKSLLLPANRGSCNITLPEDCHYRPESLVKLFVLPDVMCLRRKGTKFSDELREDNTDFFPSASWDNENMINDQLDDANVCSDVEDPGSLLRKPRQVNKIDIQYDKVSKQVDVHALKDTLWNHIQESFQNSQVEKEATVSLTQVMHLLPNNCPADSAKDISPHLLFICLLHLANEHCLALHDCPTLDEVDIRIPTSALA